MTVKIAYKAVLVPTLAIAIALGLFAIPSALATGGGHWGGGGDDVTVVNNNNASIFNGVLTVADTGDNSADGYEGGDGGEGGDTGNANGGYKGGDGGTTGDADGGDGGEGGLGGLIITGNAYAGTAVLNDINSNKTVVNSCGCEDDGWGWGGDDVTVRNNNTAHVTNLVGTIADTGDNNADGYEGGDGSEGGDTGNANGGAGGGHHWWWGGSDGGNGGTTGEADGGAGGEGGWGGQIQTGNAAAETAVVNVVNRNVTRIRR